MATFDETLERFLADPTRGALPGVDNPSIDSVAWHDFAQYELLLAPLEYEPPPVGGTEEGEHVDPDLPNTDYDPEFDPGLVHGPEGSCRVSSASSTTRTSPHPHFSSSCRRCRAPSTT